jgi:hypothetical protein
VTALVPGPGRDRTSAPAWIREFYGAFGPPPHARGVTRIFALLVVEALEEAIAIATKKLEETVADLQKIMSEPADDKKKATVKNIACSATGEFLGTARASRAVASVCSPNQRTALAAFDKSIKEMEAKIDGTCR